MPLPAAILVASRVLGFARNIIPFLWRAGQVVRVSRALLEDDDEDEVEEAAATDPELLWLLDEEDEDEW